MVTESIAHPREIDQDLVDAQQARRILDRIVGYQLSPLLWKKIRRGLSAGRVQSVATRLVVDREKEIRDFVPQEYWTLDALLSNDGGVPFRASYYGKDGKKIEPARRRRPSGIQAEVQALLRRQEREAHGQAAPARPALYHLHLAAGGLPEAEHDSPRAPWPSPSSCMRAWTSPARAPWV